MGSGVAALPGEHADLVAVGVGVEVAAEDRREGVPASQLGSAAMKAAIGPHLVLADVALVEPPVQVGAVRLDGPSRPVDVGPDAGPRLVGVRRRRERQHLLARLIGHRESTALPNRTPSRSSRLP